jgi:hypothetical protein
MSRRAKDPTKAIVAQTLKAAFPAHQIDCEMRRRPRGGYTLLIGYSHREDRRLLTHDDIYRALSERLRGTDQRGFTPAEIQQHFQVTSIIGISGVYAVDERNP